jgi:hypothetical protein
MSLFDTVEEALNTIWKVARSRSFSIRLFIDAVAAFLGRKKPPSLSYFMKKYEMTE